MIITNEKNVAKSPSLEWLSVHGYLGVNFFFVLSGFIILQAHFKDFSSPYRTPNYLLKRFVRVFPVYWIFLTFYIGASALGLGSPNFSWDLSNLLSSYTLFPPNTETSLPLQVAWTLLHEIIFYLFFITFLIRRYLGFICFGTWLVSILTVEASTFPFFDRVFLEWNVYFFVGMLCYYFAQKATKITAWLSLIVSISCFTYYFANYQITIGQLTREHSYLHYLIAIAFGCLVYSSVALEKMYKLSFSKLSILLGNASYSIYLVHSAVISVLVIISSKIFPNIEYSTIGYLFIFVTSVIAGLVAYMIIEKPLLKYMNNVFFK
jgi:peptidoglycan/LPS O-acetylase OafA/YrhL